MIREILSTLAITIAVGSFVAIAINVGIICCFMNANRRYKQQIGGNCVE